MKKKTGWSSAIGSGVLTFATIILLALAIALVAVPKVVSGMSLTVLTQSMSPTINPGDVVVTRGIDVADTQDLKIGDVITFLPYPDDPLLVTHRIVAQSVSAQGVAFITQGDNNNVADSWGPVNDFQIRGKVMYVVPKIGYVKQWLGSSTQWIILTVAALLIAYATITFISSFRKGKQEDPDDNEEVPARAVQE